MIKNYFKIAVRNLRRFPGYTGINVLGLATGIACCLLAFMFLRHELTYDRFHDQVDDIYRVTARFARSIQFSVLPDPMVPAAIEEVPSVETGTRIWENPVIVKQDAALTEENATFVDPAFFSMFSFPLKAGVKQFTAPNSALLTAAFAEKYFGNTDPVGQHLELRLNDTFETYTIAGVLAPLPDNSTLEFELLLPFEKRYEVVAPDLRDEWGSYGVVGFVKLVADADTAAVYTQLLSLVDKYNGDKLEQDESAEDYAFLIAPLVSHHLRYGLQGFALKTGTNPAYVYLLSIIAGLVLLIACFNFMNLAAGRASSRLKEIGVRKVVGAARNQLVGQLVFEGLIVGLISAGVGGVLVYGALPFFNDLIDANLILQPASDIGLVAVWIAITATAILLAALYPSIVLAGVKSADAFSGKFKFGGANFFTRTLVVLQFACTIVFLIGSVFINKQHAFMRGASLGFEQEQVVVVPVNAPKNDEEMGEQLLARFKEALAGHPQIRSIAGSSDMFTLGNSATMKTLADGRQEILFTYRVDDAFLETMDMSLLEGRNFDQDRLADAANGIIVNEAFARVFEMDQAVGQIVPVDLVGIEQPEIVGIVKDFNFQSLHSEIKPVFFHQRRPYKINYLVAKIAPDQVPASLAALQETWAAFRPDYPFEYHFLDEVIDEQYKVEAQWSSATRFASYIAIFIACLGLLGLTALTMSRRTKEIGIRKVLGASTAGLLQLLAREFAMLVVIANVLAWPLAYFGVQWWLEGFSYRIDLGLNVFIGIGLLTLLIALLTISYQSIKTAMSDPVQSLKYE